MCRIHKPRVPTPRDDYLSESIHRLSVRDFLVIEDRTVSTVDQYQLMSIRAWFMNRKFAM